MNAQVGTHQTISPVQPRRFGLNLIGNVGQLGLTMVVGVFYVPFLVRHLGPAVYGLVPLISMVTAYMNLITMGLDSAVARSMSIALESRRLRKKRPHGLHGPRSRCIHGKSRGGQAA